MTETFAAFRCLIKSNSNRATIRIVKAAMINAKVVVGREIVLFVESPEIAVEAGVVVGVVV
jgi:hypothetical protein